jgi:hypothetical protein
MLEVYQVTSPYFCAGIVVANGVFIKEAAPILAWSIGKHINWFKDYCEKKRWQMELTTIVKL